MDKKIKSKQNHYENKLFTVSAQAFAKDILNAVEDETIKTWVLKKGNNGSYFLTTLLATARLYRVV